jgi:hypothetical protein
MTYVLLPQPNPLYRRGDPVGMVPQQSSCLITDFGRDPTNGFRIVTPPPGLYLLDGRREVEATRSGISWMRSIEAPLSSPTEVIRITGDPAIEGNVLRGREGTAARNWVPWSVLEPVT